MKRVLSLLALCVCLLTIGIAAHAETKIYVTQDANLRLGPSKDYVVYTSVSEGKTLTYLNDSSYDDRGVLWYNVSHKGKSLWISSRCSTKKTTSYTSSDKRVKTTADCNLRYGPSLDYGIYTMVAEGSSLTYLGDSKKDDRGVKWYKVSYSGETLWVSSRNAYIKDSSSSGTVYVDEDANLRKGPSKDYVVYASVTKGTKLKYLGDTKKDDRGVKWYKVSYKGETLWISSRTCTKK
jgi:uncharacterized protein YraI